MPRNAYKHEYLLKNMQIKYPNIKVMFINLHEIANVIKASCNTLFVKSRYSTQVLKKIGLSVVSIKAHLIQMMIIPFPPQLTPDTYSKVAYMIDFF